jgi:hypothetical protein
MRKAAGEFSELSFGSIDVEEMATVGSFLYFCNLSASSGELDVVANLKFSH